MSCHIETINYCPVKSLSFQSINSCNIKKKLGMPNDRIFAFSRGVDSEKTKLLQENPNERKLNNFLTLKNSPVLNKYNFIYKENMLTLTHQEKEIITISTNNPKECSLLSDKLSELESSLVKPISLLKNQTFPFYDTTNSNNIFNSMSLINLNSIKDFEKNMGKEVEHQRFRGNFYIDGLDAWEERSWIGKSININGVPFKVDDHIARCSATNLKPKSGEITFNLPQKLKEFYDHMDLGVYLIPLEDGEVSVKDKIII